MNRPKCERHRWRVGASCGRVLILPEATVSEKLHLWCERCDAVKTAYNYSKHDWEKMKRCGAKEKQRCHKR